MESGLPKSIECPTCGNDIYRFWIWEGVHLYECRDCKNIYVEGEIVNEN